MVLEWSPFSTSGSSLSSLWSDFRVSARLSRLVDEDTRSSFSQVFEDRLGVVFVLCRLWDAVLSMCVDFCPLYFNCGGAP